MVYETPPLNLQIPTNLHVGESSKNQTHNLPEKSNQYKKDTSNEQDTTEDPDFCIWDERYLQAQ